MKTVALVRELRAASEPEALAAALSSTGCALERVGLEACLLTAWLRDDLLGAGLPAICIVTRQANATMKTMPNKTDRNDARALAQIMCTGCFRALHVKRRNCRLSRSLLVARRTVLNGMRSIENVVRAVLRGEPEEKTLRWSVFPANGIKLGTPARAKFAETVRERAGHCADVMAMVRPLLKVLAVMLEQLAALTKQVLDAARGDPVCRQLMTAPGVGPVTALTFRATIEDPAQFRRSRDVGAHLGLTPSRCRSGKTDRQGRISRCGDELARTALYEAAHSLLTRSRRWSALRAWGMAVAKRRGMARARVAVARKLATILQHMWRHGATFHFGAKPAAA